jgi:hypothetical protein
LTTILASSSELAGPTRPNLHTQVWYHDDLPGVVLHSLAISTNLRDLRWWCRGLPSEVAHELGSSDCYTNLCMPYRMVGFGKLL